jgi:hypothetical protein
MTGNNFASTLHIHDPLSYIDTEVMNGMSQPPNGLNLSMPVYGWTTAIQSNDE